MNIDRAKQLALEHGFSLEPGVGWDWNLYGENGSGRFGARELVDTLHQNQILHLNEEDFIEYYLF